MTELRVITSDNNGPAKCRMLLTFIISTAVSQIIVRDKKKILQRRNANQKVPISFLKLTRADPNCHIELRHLTHQELSCSYLRKI